MTTLVSSQDEGTDSLAPKSKKVVAFMEAAFSLFLSGWGAHVGIHVMTRAHKLDI